MSRGHAGLPSATELRISKRQLLTALSAIDGSEVSRRNVLELETRLGSSITSHLSSLPTESSTFAKFNTNPFVLMIHTKNKGYTSIDQLEQDILPAKEFSSMETSAGRMIESVMLPAYGWQIVPSGMHTANSALDGKKIEPDMLKLVTLKSGPRCLNDEMSANFADDIVNNVGHWANEAQVQNIDFTYGVLYGTKKQSNKKDWHILRNIKEKLPTGSLITSPDNRWDCKFRVNGITVTVTIRIGLDWWQHLGGQHCFIELCTALVRACVRAGGYDSTRRYRISDLGQIVSTQVVPDGYNVGLLQRSQLEWLFFLARHFCDSITD